MTKVETRGFTVIEVMLFLGITGIMFAALMVGVNGNITQQRYLESVRTFASLLQNQFSEVANPRNERNNNWACNNGAVQSQSVNGDPRGRSDCVVLGRAIQVVNDGSGIAGGSVIRTYVVVGVEPSGATALSDIDALVAYRPKRINNNNFMTSTSLDWGSKLLTTEHTPSSLSILILRSPASGLVRAYTSVNALPTDLATIITPENATSVVKNCIDGERGFIPVQSISINPEIAGADSVTTGGADPECD